jgi:predicted Rossmann fold flavoprotein
MNIDTLILGAGAAGMMCATHCKNALVIDHARAPGEKIRISGGGRCNFTNMGTSAENFLSENPHFAKSALARYTQWDFIDLVASHGIAYHEKTLGQLFCDDSAKQIVKMLRDEMDKAGAKLWLQTEIKALEPTPEGYRVLLDREGARHTVHARNLVVATGGKSIPKMGATGVAYDIATQFDLRVTETRPALVPFIFSDNPFKPLSGVACPSRISNDRAAFDEALLFTHRGLSGPAVLQISSYWREGETVIVNLDLDNTLFDALTRQRQIQGRRNLTTELSTLLPARLIDHLAQEHDLKGNLADWSDARLKSLVDTLQNWALTPTGSEGYRTAEVTLGGVATEGLNSKTLATKNAPSLYFIGEAVDVTGWLGGYNFQWAWSSAVATANDITSK